MQLKSLQLFMAVVNTGSFVAAAQRCHTVQSNVTAHIKKLEEELDARLFHRQGGARLTTAGRALETHARQMLKAHDEVISLFRGDPAAATALRLGAMETTTALRLPPILSDYHRRYPDVDLTLDTGPSAELLARLLDGELDGIFIAGRPEHRRLHALPVFEEQLVLVGSTPMTTLPTAEQFQQTAFLAFRQGCSYRQRIELLLAACGVNATRIFEFGSIDGILGCTAAGMGYSLMPRSTVEAHQARFDIHLLELPAKIAEVTTYFVAADASNWTPALARFVDGLNAGTDEAQ